MINSPACECERATGVCLGRFEASAPAEIAASAPTFFKEVASMRSDAESAARRLELLLAAANRPGLRRVHVAYENDAVVLTGCVRSFYEKLLAVRICQREAMGLRVVDDIAVVDDRPASLTIVRAFQGTSEQPS